MSTLSLILENHSLRMWLALSSIPSHMFGQTVSHTIRFIFFIPLDPYWVLCYSQTTHDNRKSFARGACSFRGRTSRGSKEAGAQELRVCWVSSHQQQDKESSPHQTTCSSLEYSNYFDMKWRNKTLQNIDTTLLLTWCAYSAKMWAR